MQQYILAGETLLSDKASYTFCETLPDILQIKEQLKNILRKYNKIYFKNPYDTCEYYTPLANTLLEAFTRDSYQFARLYLCPKIHKEEHLNEWIKQQWRPISASIGWVTYEVSTYIDTLLKPVMINIPTYIKDSASLVKELNYKQFPKDCYLLEADVDNMYPSINIQHALEFIEAYLKRLNDNTIPINLIIELLRWIHNNNYIEFNNKIYLQIKGTAMGTPCAVTFACIYMAEIEYRVTIELRKNKISLPIYIKRFIDDFHGIFNKEYHCQKYCITFNSIAPGLHLTISTNLIYKQLF